MSSDAGCDSRSFLSATRHRRSTSIDGVMSSSEKCHSGPCQLPLGRPARKLSIERQGALRCRWVLRTLPHYRVAAVGLWSRKDAIVNGRPRPMSWRIPQDHQADTAVATLRSLDLLSKSAVV